MEQSTEPLAKPLVAIETSGASGSVALLLTNGTLSERDVGRPAAPAERPSGHGRELLPAIDALVAEAGIAKADIGAVAVSVGPGSYTGLRIGVTAAKTLAWALGRDLVGVPTLEALAREAATQGVPEGTRRLVPVVDARQREVYAAVFDLEGEHVTRASDDAAVPPAELATRLREGDHVFGTGIARSGEALTLPEGATSAEGPTCPRAGTVARMGAELVAGGKSIDIHDAAPVYLRASEAERKASIG
ncbi:MAG: tRNA (adenosine(37)-N6)-threonylcarbamoyltransferase complex dimerization subunit type 1 TsaB [Planctomycetota bacterium]|jgi:tRNA threonylcarbamoyladenosine biosynthesis protein TsaB